MTLQQLLLKLKQFEQNVMVQIDNAVKNAQSTYESVSATKQARIYAEAALDAEQKKYAVGKSTTFTVLQLQNTLTTARSQEIRALANYYEALANLAQQEGSTLERNRINVEVKVIREYGWHFAGPKFKDGDTLSLPGIHQKCQAPRQMTHKPSRKFVMACAVIASPSRCLRITSH